MAQPLCGPDFVTGRRKPCTQFADLAQKRRRFGGRAGRLAWRCACDGHRSNPNPVCIRQGAMSAMTIP
jgi:hypothetical protein